MFCSSPTTIQCRAPLERSKVVIDPYLVVPRLDPTIEEALRLQDIATPPGGLTREGLEAEKAGRFQAAMGEYDAAIAAVDEAVLSRFRRARVDAALDRFDAPLEAHTQLR